MKLITISCLCLFINLHPQSNSALQKLSKVFFEWRSITQPATGDDIPRIERPDGWSADYSPEALKNYKLKYIEFSKALKEIPQTSWTRADSIDFLLLHSAIERVNWELNILNLPESHPEFYVQQAVGSIFELLLIHSPMNENCSKNILYRMKAIPSIIKSAEENLVSPVQAFADIAINMLNGMDNNLTSSFNALKKDFPDYFSNEIDKDVNEAVQSLNNYMSWLQERRKKMNTSFSVGRKDYEYFLKNIAFVPYTPEEILQIGKTEWNRSVAFDVFEKLRNKHLPPAKLFSSSDEQILQEKKDEEAIRVFLVEKGIMSVPDWIQHYLNRELPDYLEPLKFMGVTDDLTSENRLDENSVSFISEPSPNLSFFKLAIAHDPRSIIVHEGVPGHYFQMALSWKNPDPIRRHYFDSNSNEGIGFYVEELMQQFGLFDDRPHTRETIYSFMRLRALRVDVDVNLALGNYSIEQAADYLEKTVPMDKATAIAEAGFFASTPGQAITYQIGKSQILNLIADAKIKMDNNFIIKDYHDYMMVNGNIPIALQRWEYLGLKDEIEKMWPK